MIVDAEATKLEVEVLRQADKIATLIIAWSDVTDADRDRIIDFLAYDSTDRTSARWSNVRASRRWP